VYTAQGRIRELIRVRVADAKSSSMAGRKLSKIAGLLLLAIVAGGLANPPVARAYDEEYYLWCLGAIGGRAFCCNQAGGVYTGSGCANAVPSQAPEYIPPNTGGFFP